MKTKWLNAKATIPKLNLKRIYVETDFKKSAPHSAISLFETLFEFKLS